MKTCFPYSTIITVERCLVGTPEIRTSTVMRTLCVVPNVSYVPYFLKYSPSKIFAVDWNLCISEIIRTSKFRGWVVSEKIITLQKLSVTKVNEGQREFASQTDRSTNGRSLKASFAVRVARLHMRAVRETHPLGTLAFVWSWLQVSKERQRRELVEKGGRWAK